MSAFKNGWNRHSFRTKDGQSPPAIICFRCSSAPTVRLRQSGIAALDFFENVGDEQYGVEEEELVADEENSIVVIPENPLQ